MSDRPQNEDSRPISEQAADWLILIRAGDMSEEERLEYVHWMKQSPDHIREMLELVSLEQVLRESHAPPAEAEPPSEASKVVGLDVPGEK